ncbi:helix-turn-helix domain-containing protein [Streptomyces sp. WMMC500]|uniref:GbsR/MarR family transcriptional regulator n=1 Tax=Streptomyces sp. WMMC500 TaxID=3015154 RepID=UPI00248B76C5|nr:helix-turn-helix domain-containing protein [Streptomyces sp. WMMC500]WBB64294.1 helix-turn-helix domain-containing protein [Streptomyces sp. WMMC500]
MADQQRDERGGRAERGDGAERTDRASRDESAVLRYVERVAGELTEMGMQRMASRVFACLLADDSGALTAAEVGERLHVSPAAVSGAVRYLAAVGLITREREPGSRRERYRMESDRWYQIFAQREHMIRRFEQTLDTGVGILGPETPAGRRIEETTEFFAFLREENGRLEQRWWDYVKRRDEARAAGE